MTDPKPFVKSVGGKTQLLSQLLPHIPDNITGYYEPFVGGGAVFWKLAAEGRLKGKPVVLGDKNAAMIDLYKEVRDDPEYLVGYLGRMQALYAKDPEALYYEVRGAWNERVQTPGMLLFLRQTAFNGLFRYSKAGRLNSAWGHYAAPRLLDEENLRLCSQALQGVELVTGTVFEQLAAQPVRKGWLYYLDPPYHGTFDGYDADGFIGEDHAALIRLAAHLTAEGAHVLYSNSDHPEIREWIKELWGAAQVHEISGRNFINRDGQGRGKRTELLAVGKPQRVVVVRQPVRFVARFS